MEVKNPQVTSDFCLQSNMRQWINKTEGRGCLMPWLPVWSFWIIHAQGHAMACSGWFYLAKELFALGWMSLLELSEEKISLKWSGRVTHWAEPWWVYCHHFYTKVSTLSRTSQAILIPVYREQQQQQQNEQNRTAAYLCRPSPAPLMTCSLIHSRSTKARRLVEKDVFYGSEDASHSLDTDPFGFVWQGARECCYTFCWAMTWVGWRSWRWWRRKRRGRRRLGVHNFLSLFTVGCFSGSVPASCGLGTDVWVHIDMRYIYKHDHQPVQTTPSLWGPKFELLRQS